MKKFFMWSISILVLTVIFFSIGYKIGDNSVKRQAENNIEKEKQKIIEKKESSKTNSIKEIDLNIDLLKDVVEGDIEYKNTSNQSVTIYSECIRNEDQSNQNNIEKYLKLYSICKDEIKIIEDFSNVTKERKIHEIIVKPGETINIKFSFGIQITDSKVKQEVESILDNKSKISYKYIIKYEK